MISLRRIFAPLAFSLLISLSGAQTAEPPQETKPPELTAEKRQEVLTDMAKVLKEEAFVPGVDFSKWDEFIAKKSEDLGKADTITAFTRIVNLSLREFGISHVRLLTPRASEQRGKTTTIGMGVATAPEEKGLRITRVMDGSPAKAAGLGEKDLIIEVNGQKPAAPTEIQGEKGTKLSLKVETPSGEIKSVELELQEFSTIRKETLTWYGEDTAVLKVFTFAAGYGRENIESLLKEATEKKAKHLILDLRNNGGGQINNMNHLLSLLMPDNTAYGTMITKRIAKSYAESRPTAAQTPEAIAEWAPNKSRTRQRRLAPFSGTISVMINRGSGSASEITAAALRECVNAKLYGKPSAGAVLASVYKKLSHGFSLQHPISDYITIKGVRLEGNPIKPDVEVDAGVTVDGQDKVIAAILNPGSK